MSLGIDDVGRILKKLYLPAIREQEVQIAERGMIFLGQPANPALAKRLREMSDDDFIAWFREARPMPDEDV